MITIVAGIIMLGILVFVHELGHFCVAKLCGVKVLKFSLGFGPRLISHQRGETEYMICAIPLGGYVQMLGEGGGDQGEEAEVDPDEEERSFAKKSIPRRMAIVAAGPIMNLILPFMILPIAYLVGINLPAYLEDPPCVGYVVPGSEAAESGFRNGDCIVKISGMDVATWTDTGPALVSSAGEPIIFTLDRDDGIEELIIDTENGALEGLQSIGLLPGQDAVIGGLAPAMPAVEAGLQEGDRILSIGKREIVSWYELKDAIQEASGQPVAVVIERNMQQLTLELTPKKVDGNDDYLIGVAPHHETIFKRFPFGEAVAAGAERTVDLIELTLIFIQKLFAGHVSSSNIGGPITVVQIAGQAAQTDISSVLSILAFLSIQLGILNLLPIPILDGGHLFFYTFELVFRRPLSLRAREWAQQIGLILLIMLMGLAFYNDIVRMLGS
ncbi:MAG: RIP metalloprotease RseP [Desulfuromonadales bacterium]|nr:RIP metalloprotease RseP [Desulfuromonadales bacterium]